MVQILRPETFIGNRVFIETDPNVLTLKGHIFNPSINFGCAPGIYDPGRRVVNASLYFRGPDPEAVFPGLCSSFQYSDVCDWAEEDDYVYLGPLHNHFGHFLLSTLSRLWSIRQLPSNLKILCHNDGTLTSEIRKPYVREIFAALDINLDRLVTITHPTRFKSITLPNASFEERNFVHRVFAQHCNAIGDQIVGDQLEGVVREKSTSRPLYLSKSQISSGVRRIVNEQDIDDLLLKKGFDIAYPEQLSFREQISLWREPRPIVSFSGSGLHTSLFSRNAQLVCLNYDGFVDTSFVLCDWANRTEASYFYFEDGTLENLGSTLDPGTGSGFSTLMRANDPQAVADCIARALDGSGMGPGLTERRRKSDVKNLSSGKSTTQSSHFDERDLSGLSVTSGFLTGRYQFCTKHETSPWLQVDLGCEYDVTEIIVFNRNDSASERAANLLVSGSSDGIQFFPIFARSDPDPFGGLNGCPLHIVLENVVAVRYVRFSITGPEFLHLDQVEILGKAKTRREDL